MNDHAGKDGAGTACPDDEATTPARQAGASFAVTVNDRMLQVEDRTPTARQILAAAGFNPADEHILIQDLKTGTQSVALDEIVDLGGKGRERFFAFASDRIFRFTLDGLGFEWGAPKIAEPMIRDIGRVDDGKAIVLEQVDAPDTELGPEDHLVLGERGTEHLRTVKGLVSVCIDDEIRKIPRGSYTTEQLLEVLGVEPGYLINVIDADGQLRLLEPGEKIRVREGMKFISQVPCGGSS